MGSSYQSTVMKSSANITNITNIMTQNQNVVSATVIVSQSQYITIGTVNCTNGVNFSNNADITVTITGQMNSNTANDISTYITSSIDQSLSQSAKVLTELFGVYGSSIQKADIMSAINQFAEQNITTTNLQAVLANVRATQTQNITIGTLTGSLCTFTNNIVVAVAASGVLDSISNNLATSDLTSKMSQAVAQYYDAKAKGLNSLVSAALTALLLPVIIVAAAIALVIILIVVFKLLSGRNHNAAVTQARQLGLDPTKADPVKDNAAIQKTIDAQQQKIDLANATKPQPAAKSATSVARAAGAPVRAGARPPPIPPKPAGLRPIPSR